MVLVLIISSEKHCMKRDRLSPDSAEERLREPELAPQEQRLLARESSGQFSFGGGTPNSSATTTADPTKRIPPHLYAELDWVCIDLALPCHI